MIEEECHMLKKQILHASHYDMPWSQESVCMMLEEYFVTLLRKKPKKFLDLYEYGCR